MAFLNILKLWNEPLPVENSEILVEINKQTVYHMCVND